MIKLFSVFLLLICAIPCMAMQNQGIGAFAMETVPACTSQTITWGTQPTASLTVGGSNGSVGSATSDSQLTVTYTSSNINDFTISGSSTVPVGAGTAYIVASQAGNGTYCAATSVNSNNIVVSDYRFTDNFAGTNGSAPNTAYWSAMQNNNTASGGGNITGTWDIESNTLYYDAKYGVSTDTNCIWFYTVNSLPMASGRYFEVTFSGVITSTYVHPRMQIFSTNNLSDFQSTGYSASKYDNTAHNAVALVFGTSTVQLYTVNNAGSATALGSAYTFTNSGTNVIRITLIDSTHASVQINGSTVISSVVINPTWGSNIQAFIGVDSNGSPNNYRDLTITEAAFQ